MVDKYNECDTIVHQFLKLQAQVNSTPRIKHGKPKVCCFYSNLKPDCTCTEDSEYTESETQAITDKCGNNCSFTLTQLFCVQIPIAFDVDVDIDEGIVRCSKPAFGACKPKCYSCSMEENEITDDNGQTDEIDITREMEITEE